MVDYSPILGDSQFWATVIGAMLGVAAGLALLKVVAVGARMVLDMIGAGDDDPYRDPDLYIWPNKYDDDNRF